MEVLEQIDLRLYPILVALVSASGCDLNRSMQHLNSNYRAEDVADETETEDILQRRAEKLDVGSLASGQSCRHLRLWFPDAMTHTL